MARPSQRITLSVVLPAYNEQDRLLPYLTSIILYLSQRGDPYEIVVVDDGSRDETAQRVRQFAADAREVRLIQLPGNAGKGAAVRAGMLAAHGALRLMADADGATPIQEIDRLEHALSEGADLAIGSRFLGSRDSRYRVQARWHRTVLGNAFNQMAQRLGLEGITDTQCGFKLFRKRVAEDLFSVSRIDGYGFDLELLYVARRARLDVPESIAPLQSDTRSFPKTLPAPIPTAPPAQDAPTRAGQSQRRSRPSRRTATVSCDAEMLEHTRPSKQ